MKSYLCLLLVALVVSAVSAFGVYNPVLKTPSAVSEQASLKCYVKTSSTLCDRPCGVTVNAQWGRMVLI